MLSQSTVPTVSAAPEDYTKVDYTITGLTIPKDADTVSFTLEVNDDSLVEDYMEIFNLKLVRIPSTLPTCAIDSSNGLIDVNIIDNDCK